MLPESFFAVFDGRHTLIFADLPRFISAVSKKLANWAKVDLRLVSSSLSTATPSRRRPWLTTRQDLGRGILKALHRKTDRALLWGKGPPLGKGIAEITSAPNWSRMPLNTFLVALLELDPQRL